MSSAIRTRLENIRQRIEAAKERAGRRDDVQIVAVTKGVSLPEIREAYCSGIGIFGENRVQEALPKIASCDFAAEWHFIGHLQRNKVKYVIDNFSLIHSVDSSRLLEELEKRAKKAGKTVDALLQVNVSGEESKFGVPPDKVEELLEKMEGFSSVFIRGLMTIAPYTENPEDIRWVFRELRRLFEKIGDINLKQVEMRYLSMGMSNDFEVAVEEGANMVRIGSAIFRG